MTRCVSMSFLPMVFSLFVKFFKSYFLIMFPRYLSWLSLILNISALLVSIFLKPSSLIRLSIYHNLSAVLDCRLMVHRICDWDSLNFRLVWVEMTKKKNQKLTSTSNLFFTSHIGGLLAHCTSVIFVLFLKTFWVLFLSTSDFGVIYFIVF